jgi:DNA polymerase-1
MIHDAIYLLIKDDIKVVEWVNNNLIECMEWQELPELRHDTVKLGAELSIFWPDWSSEIVLSNKSTQKEIRTQCKDFQTKYKASS